MGAEGRVLDWDYDSRTGRVRVGEGAVALTDTEAKAFGYLAARAGRTVSRETLEREVWGLSPGVRSETVPVTMRKVRSKLAAAGAPILTAVRGVGWRVQESEARRRVGLPVFGTPLFDRPTDVASVRALWDEGWRVVSIVGPGGAGKTRLVAEVARALPVRVNYVELGSARSESDVELAVLSAAGMTGGGLQGLAIALGNQTAVFVLDEVELTTEQTSAVIDALPQHRFLVTSRRALDRSDEAIHAISGLHGEAGRRFARSRMAAAKWDHQPSDDVLDALLKHLDGLPLALEVIAAHPDPPERLLRGLEAGQLPGGRQGAALQEALATSYTNLEPATRELLEHLSVAGCVLSEQHILDWRGPEAAEHLEVLSHRSLVQREQQGWRVSTTMRSFVLSRIPDVTALRDSFDGWLVQHFRTATEAVERHPTETLDRLIPLTEPALTALGRRPPQDLPPLLWMLYLLAMMRGPAPLFRTALNLALDRAPQLPLVALLSAFAGDAYDPAALGEALDRADEEDQARALLGQSLIWLPRGPLLSGWQPRPATSRVFQLHQARAAMMSRSLDEARALAKAAPDLPLLTWIIRSTLAQRLRHEGRQLEAVAAWEDLVDELHQANLLGARLFAMHGLADSWLEVDPLQAADAYVAASDAAQRMGFGDSWTIGRGGVFLALLGQNSEALPRLQQGARGDHLPSRLACAALACVIGRRARAEVEDPVPSLEGIHGTLVDGSDLHELVRAVTTRTPMAGNTMTARVWSRTLSSTPS